MIDRAPADKTSVCFGVLSAAFAVSGRHGNLRLFAPLVAELRALGHTVRLTPPAFVKS